MHTKKHILKLRKPSFILFIFLFMLTTTQAWASQPIAVMPLESKNKNLGKKVSAYILTRLARTRRFTLVERGQLQKALKEIALSQSGSINSKQALRIGKMSGAKYLILGDLQLLPQKKTRRSKSYQANIRIIKTETGIIIGADHATGTLRQIKASLYYRVKKILDIYLTMNNPDSPYSILLKLNKGKNPVYKTGETLELQFKVKKHLNSASNNVYIQIYSIDARGAMTMIYPNKFANGMNIQIDKKYHFPQSSDDFEWELVPPVGTENIQAIVTTKPVFFFKESKNFKTKLFPSLRKKESAQLYSAIRIRIKKDKLKDWSAERITYTLLKGSTK